MKRKMAINLIGSIILSIPCHVSIVIAGGPLPLITYGVYVESDRNCDEAMFRDMVIYNGHGFEYNRSWCSITKANKKGNVYHVTEKCDYYPMGEGDTSTIKEIITIKNETSFTLRVGKQETAYKLCDVLKDLQRNKR